MCKKLRMHDTYRIIVWLGFWFVCLLVLRVRFSVYIAYERSQELRCEAASSSLLIKPWTTIKRTFRVQEPCENRGGRPGLPVPDSLRDLCGRKATVNLKRTWVPLFTSTVVT